MTGRRALDLRELRYFRTVVECGTFSKAAAQLRIAQPALSRQVKKLEHSLGVDLLVRTSKGVTPTEAGLALLRRTTQLERDVREARREVSGYAEGVFGAIHTAWQYPLTTQLVPQLVRKYRDMFPSVSVHLYDGFSRAIVDALLSEDLDIALIDSPSHEHPELVTIPLWVEKLHLVGPPAAAGMDIFKGEKASLEEISRLPIVIPSRTSSLRRTVDIAFGRQQLKFEPAFEADGQVLNFEMVKAGLGYTIFPPIAFAAEKRAGALVSVEVSPAIYRTNSIVTRKSLLEDRKIAPMIELIKAGVREMAESGAHGPLSLCAELMTQPAKAAPGRSEARARAPAA
jgi:LysR family nitrogen assimilation transcriptional regulator